MTTRIIPPITVTNATIMEWCGITDMGVADRLRVVASEVVNRYAPFAPTILKDEAILRFVGYLAQSDFGGVKSETIGPRSVEYSAPSTNASAFRSSGAAALLTPYRRRRAGAI